MKAFCGRTGLISLSVAMLAATSLADAAGPLPPPESTVFTYAMLALMLCGLPTAGYLLLMLLIWAARKVFGKGAPPKRNIGCLVCTALFLCYLVFTMGFLVWQFVEDYRQAKADEPRWRESEHERRRRIRERADMVAPERKPDAAVTNSPGSVQ